MTIAKYILAIICAGICILALIAKTKCDSFKPREIVFTEHDLKRKRVRNILGTILLLSVGTVGVIFMHDSPNLLFVSIFSIAVLAPINVLIVIRITKLLKIPNQGMDPTESGSKF